MGGSHGGEADEKTRQFVRAELEVRTQSLLLLDYALIA